MGNRQAGPPQMATMGRAATDGAPNLCTGGTDATASSSITAQRRGDTSHRQEITCDKRAADAPQAAGALRAAPRAQAPPITMRDLQPGPEVAGTSHLSDDLRRYVSLLVQ